LHSRCDHGEANSCRSACSCCGGACCSGCPSSAGAATGGCPRAGIEPRAISAGVPRARARRAGAERGEATRAALPAPAAPRRSASHLRRALDRTIRSPSGCCVPYFRRRQSTQTVRAMRRQLPHPTRQPHHRAVVGSAKDRILRSSQARITRLSRRTRSSSNLRASCSGASKATSYATTSGVASTSTICWGPRCCFTRWRMPLTMQVQAGSAALPRMGRRLVEA